MKKSVRKRVDVQRGSNSNVYVERLVALVGHKDSLPDTAAKAFPDMLRKYRLGIIEAFTQPMRDWIDKEYASLELDADEGSKNLVSAGLVPQGFPEPDKRHYETLPAPRKNPQQILAELRAKKEKESA